ncbi:MAG TPA: hypothetical protein VFS75_03340 [Candidatus Paceibacterota bacterium]|nr:hypothetical protein [Candidatus Paceibacterota bacterium]
MKPAYIYAALVVLVVGGLVALKQFGGTSNAADMAPYDDFAQCLTDHGVKFFGAYWCPHCQAQKRLFHNSKKLPYIECSTPDGQSQTQICIDNKITGYPTWEFADGSRLDGEQTFEDLGAKADCPVPQAAT